MNILDFQFYTCVELNMSLLTFLLDNEKEGLCNNIPYVIQWSHAYECEFMFINILDYNGLL